MKTTETTQANQKFTTLVGTLTELETKALQGLIDSSDGNGHDFGFTDECVDNKDKSAVGALGSLVKKLGNADLVWTEDLSQDPGIECNSIQIGFDGWIREALDSGWDFPSF